ncbi:MAG: MOSC domain-containing protein [Thermomicrobiales bacterium]
MNDPVRIGPVVALSRYPVKSLRGESLAQLTIEPRGVVGDRLFALRNADGKFGSGKSTRRFRKMDGLLDLAAAYEGATPMVAFPGGDCIAGDDPAIHERLSAHVGQAVTLARETDISHFDDSPIHVLTTASLRTLGLGAADAARFRPNIVIDAPGYGFVEDGWIGRDLLLGEGVRLRVTGGAVRCVMVGMAQAELPEQPQLLRQIGKLHDACFGVYAQVVDPGAVALSDLARLA